MTTNLDLAVDLQIEDSMEEKFALAFSMAHRPDLLPPIYVLSHKRADNFVTFKSMPWMADIATVVVAHTEEAKYRELWPKVKLAVIPPGYGGHDIGIGRALQFILDTADMIGQEHILTIHDDLKSINMLYDVGQGKVSRAFTSIVGEKRQDFYRGCITLFAQCAEEAYATHEDAVIASPQVNNANRTLKSSQRRWELNSGGNPAQLQSWRVDRFLKQVGGLNLEDFNYHGEDISLACDIAEARCQVVNMPTFITDYLDYENESVIRDHSNAHILRQGEHDALMKKEVMAQYVKTRTDLLDRPQWHSLDWPKLKKDGRIKADEKLWTDPS